MGTWRHLLGGLLLWTAHFFAVYGIASLFPGQDIAVGLVLVVTLGALAAAALLFARAMKQYWTADDQLRRWISSGAAFGYALAGVAVLYQGMPAIFL